MNADIQKDKNALLVGQVVRTATTLLEEVRQYPATRLTVSDVAPLQLTAEEVSRIRQGNV